MDWNKIMHTALLGTDKAALPEETGTDALAAAHRLVMQQAGDKEDQFLQMAAIALNYRKCGGLPVREQVLFPAAAPEEPAYCSAAARQVLDEIISLENIPLLGFWLQQCATARQLLPPERLPYLFELSQKQQAIHPSLVACAGRRGEWLLQLNDAWKGDQAADEDTWHTGTLQQRLIFLDQLRTSHPARAGELVRQAWPQENANTRAELLKRLHGTVNEEDLSWLEPLMAEKSQKVREETLSLLKEIPGSSVVQQYWNIVRQAVQIKKTKGLLGLGSKTSLEIALPAAIDDNIFKTGIEKMSSQKGVSDTEHILIQLMEAVPPALFEKEYDLTREEIIELFNKSKQAQRYLPALGNAAVLFKDKEWLKAIIPGVHNTLYYGALLLFDQEDAEAYLLRFIERKELLDPIIQSATEYFKTEWGKELTRKVFIHTAKHHYQYNRSFYSKHVLLFPAAIIPELESCAPADPYAREAWSKTSETIAQLINLKVQTRQAFQTT